MIKLIYINIFKYFDNNVKHNILAKSKLNKAIINIHDVSKIVVIHYINDIRTFEQMFMSIDFCFNKYLNVS